MPSTGSSPAPTPVEPSATPAPTAPEPAPTPAPTEPSPPPEVCADDPEYSCTKPAKKCGKAEFAAKCKRKCKLCGGAGPTPAPTAPEPAPTPAPPEACEDIQRYCKPSSKCSKAS